MKSLLAIAGLAAVSCVPSLAASEVHDLREPINLPPDPRRMVQVQERAHSSASATSQSLFSTNNRTSDVGWDGYSLFLKGQRILL